MGRFNSFIREPAMLLDFAESLLVLLVALGLNLTKDNETWIIAVLVALIGLAKGLSTKPFAVHFITDLGRAILMLAASFGLNLPPDKIAIIVTFLGTATTLVGSLRTTPVYDPIETTVAGPARTRSQRGGVDVLTIIGIVVVVFGILMLVGGHILIGIIVLVLGLILAVGGPAYSRSRHL